MRCSLLLESPPDGLRDLSSSFQFCKMVKADAPALTKKPQSESWHQRYHLPLWILPTYRYWAEYLSLFCQLRDALTFVFCIITIFFIVCSKSLTWAPNPSCWHPLLILIFCLKPSRHSSEAPGARWPHAHHSFLSFLGPGCLLRHHNDHTFWAARDGLLKSSTNPAFAWIQRAHCDKLQSSLLCWAIHFSLEHVC